MKITKTLKAIKDAIKSAINKIRKSKMVDSVEETVLTAVLPAIVSSITKGAFTVSPDEANKYAKEIVKGLNVAGDMVLVSHLEEL
ncbi:MAG: hypothetical protein LBK53_09280 [Heliobacteriaceae bacterium]|jgi:hypothetical protein|nr:hypothetical protein [Heliobacteriaceae bacterium]